MTKEFDNETQKTIDNIYEQIEVLKGKVDELKSCPKNKNIRWRAEEHSAYCAVGPALEIKHWIHEEGGTGYEKLASDFNYQIGNYFKTLEEAEKYKNYLIITQKLKDIALRLNDGIEIVWNKSTPKYAIFYRHLENTYRELLVQGKAFDVSYLNGIYCLSDKFLETAIKEIGEKELIEYIKGC